MKKIIIFLALILPLSFALNAQQANKSLKRIKIIDQAENPVRHWRLYSFEMENQQPANMELLMKNLKAVKGVTDVVPRNETISKRILITINFDMRLSKSVELKNAFTNSGFEITNMPDSEK